MRLVLRPRCSSREFCRWPCRTASVVPIIAGHAAIAAGGSINTDVEEGRWVGMLYVLRMPRTMLK